MSSSNKQRARLAFLAGCLCAVSLGANAALEDDFNVAYESYRAAVAERRHAEAAEHAARAKQLGEARFPDDTRRIAMLVYNHGFALSQTNRRAEAYEVLKLALERLRRAFGKDSKEVMHVEVALASAALPTKARSHLKKAVKIARLRGDEDSEFIANANLMVGMRLRGRQGAKLLEEAAAAFERIDNADGLALANLWIGKIRMARGWGDAVDNFEVALAHAPRVEPQPNQPSIALLAHVALVEAFERQGRRDAATVHCLAIGRSVPWAGKANYEPLYRALPVYPTSEWKRGREGWVNMEFTVDENGIVRDAEVVESEGAPGFEVSALEALRGFRYAPRLVDGNAVAVTGLRSLMKFEISDR